MTKRPHYYYRFVEDGSVGKQLQIYFATCADAQEQARAWAEKQGAKSYYESTNGMAGGVTLVEFENCIAKEGWEKMTTPDGSVFFYPAPDSALEKEMTALPVVSENKLIPILSFKARKAKDGKTLPFTFGDETPIIFLHHGFWYVDIPYESEAEGAERIEERAFFARRMAATNER
jgi:hypothetical protein